MDVSILLWAVLAIILVIVLATIVASRARNFGAIRTRRRNICGGENEWTPSLMKEVLAQPKQRVWHTIRDLGKYVKKNTGNAADWMTDKWGVLSKHVSSHGAANFTGTNYVGPKNELTEAYYREYPPTDAVDFAGMMHDIAYDNIAKAYRDGGATREQSIADGMRADQDLLDRMAQNFGENPWAATTGGLCVWTLLQLKKMGVIGGLAFIVDDGALMPTDPEIEAAAIKGSEQLLTKGSTDDGGTPLASHSAASPSAATHSVADSDYVNSDHDWAPQATAGWAQMRRGWSGLIAQTPTAAQSPGAASDSDPLLPPPKGIFARLKSLFN